MNFQRKQENQGIDNNLVNTYNNDEEGDEQREGEQEEDEDLLGQRDIERLNGLWKAMKDEKKQVTTSSGSANFLRNSVSQEKHFNDQIKTNSQCESPNFDTALNDHKFKEQFTEINRMQEKNSTLVRKLAEAEDEIDKCHMKIAKISQMSLSNTQSQFQEVNKYAVGLLQGDIDENNKIVKQLSLSLEEYQDKYQLISSENEQLRERNAVLAKDLDAKIAENQRIKSKLRDIEEVIDDLILEKNSKGVSMLESEYLKNDIEKLLQFLGTTQEYKDFFRFAKDSRDITNLKYIPKLSNTKQDIDDKILKVQINQKMLWVPRDAFQLALHLKQKYQNRLDEKCIEELLFGYNKIFSDREEKAMDRFKKIYLTQITSLKLQLEKKTSYKQAITASKKISATLRRPNSVAISNKPPSQTIEKQIDEANKQGDLDKENQLFLTDALRLQEDYERQLQECRAEIDKLNLKVQELQVEAMKYDKLNYMEGSLWMLDKLTKEVLKFRESLIQMTKSINSTASKHQTVKEVVQNYKWFVDGVEASGEHLLQKITHMRDSTSTQVSKVKVLQASQFQASFGSPQISNNMPSCSTFASPQQVQIETSNKLNNNNNNNNNDIITGQFDRYPDILIQPPEKIENEQTDRFQNVNYQQTRPQSSYCGFQRMTSPINQDSQKTLVPQKIGSLSGYSSYEQFKVDRQNSNNNNRDN